MRKIALRVPVEIAALVLAGIAAGPRPAAAQMVPRLVDYPVTAACVPDPNTGLAQERLGNRVVVFSAPGCPSNALLYTVTAQRRHDGIARISVTPTPLGVSYLSRNCTQYAWAAGSAQDVSESTCSNFVASVP